MAEMDFNSSPAVPANRKVSVPRPKKRWLAIKIAGVVLVVMVLVLLALPTLLSTGPALSIILGQVNGNLNGRVEVASMSLGWFSGISVRGVRVFDSDKSQIAQLDSLTMPYALWKPLVGNYAFGEAVCDGLSCDAKYDADHRLNFAQLVKTKASSAKPAPSPVSSPGASDSKPRKLPEISGTIKLTNCRATVSEPGKPTVSIGNLNGEFKIPNINQPISDMLSLNIRSGNGQEGSFNLSGTATATASEIHQKLAINQLDLSAARPFLSGADTLQGVLGVQAAVDLSSGKTATADAVINVSQAGAARPVDQIHLSISGDHPGAITDLRNIKMSLTGKSINGDISGKSLADLNGAINANLTIAMDEIRQFLPGTKLNLGGDVGLKVSANGQIDQPPYQSKLSIELAGHGLQYTGTSGSPMNEPLILMDLSAVVRGSAGRSVESVQNLTLTLKTDDLKSPTIDLLAEAPNIALGQSVSADFHLTHLTADLARLQKEFSSLPPKSAGTLVEQGVVSISASGAYRDNALSLNGLKIQSDGLAFRQQTADGKISAPFSGGPLHLNGSATVQMPTTGGDTAVLNCSGDVAELSHVAAAFEGEKPDAYPYRGTFTFNENVNTQKTGTSLVGSLQLAKFESLNGSTVTFGEDLLAINNDVVLATAGDDESVLINDLLISMKSSGALNVAIKNGTVHHLQSSRDLQLQPAIDYDLAKLWPVVQPLMGDKYRTLKITGQFQKKFNITGSYPKGQPFTGAVKTVHADGDIAVATFDYDGLNLQNFIVPFTMDNGQVMTVFAGKPAGQNTAAPAVANGGKLDISDLTVDLTQDPPRLTVPPNKLLISQLTVNPLFANTYLAKFLNNPVFAGNDASGQFDLTVVNCDNLPLGGLVEQSVAANSGKADLKFSLEKLNIGYQGISGLESALKQDSFTANVKDGTVAIAKGLANEHISFATGQYSLDFDGTVRLADEALLPLNLSIGPLPALAQRALGVHDQNVLKYLPDRATIPVEGTVEHAHVALEKVLGQLLAEAGGKAITKGLLGGDKNGNGDNPLGGLLKKLR